MVRVRRHLQQVEAELRDDAPTGLDARQVTARADAIDHLHGYWEAGEFPHNTYVPDRRVPVFVDNDGRRCAVAHRISNEVGGTPWPLLLTPQPAPASKTDCDGSSTLHSQVRQYVTSDRPGVEHAYVLGGRCAVGHDAYARLDADL
ncbi:MAG TPA: hypothetical protein VGA36_09830 [Nitriliruptorales bacterium]